MCLFLQTLRQARLTAQWSDPWISSFAATSPSRHSSPGAFFTSPTPPASSLIRNPFASSPYRNLRGWPLVQLTKISPITKVYMLWPPMSGKIRLERPVGTTGFLHVFLRLFLHCTSIAKHLFAWGGSGSSAAPTSLHHLRRKI